MIWLIERSGNEGSTPIWAGTGMDMALAIYKGLLVQQSSLWVYVREAGRAAPYARIPSLCCALGLDPDYVMGDFSLQTFERGEWWPWHFSTPKTHPEYNCVKTAEGLARVRI